jgi:hypothetical protein
MTKLFWLLLLTPYLFASCENPDCKKMATEIDSLKREIHSGGRMVNAVVSVNSLLDSIDATRHVLRVHKASGIEIESYDQRMSELKDYVKQTEDKIGELEASMVETNVNSDSYLAIIAALKDELKFRNEEMGLIDKNADLHDEELLRGVQLEDLEARLEVKRIELMLLELQVTEMVRRMAISEAEGFYLQAAALEEAAKRTKLAPFKRRQIFRQAIALYEKSLAKGKKEAKDKIDELQSKVGLNDE